MRKMPLTLKDIRKAIKQALEKELKRLNLVRNGVNQTKARKANVDRVADKVIPIISALGKYSNIILPGAGSLTESTISGYRSISQTSSSILRSYGDTVNYRKKFIKGVSSRIGGD